jgi:hypothetical protein
MTIVESGCCCDGAEQVMYLATACWPNRSRAFSFVEPTGSDVTTIFNGINIDSTNPPTATPAIVWMVGAGGGSQSSDVIGGAGAILEKQTTLPASSTVKVGQGGFGSTGTASNVATVFGGGRKGAANATAYGQSYGGGATGWTGASGMIAGGGGGGGSQEFFTQYATDANGGDAGIASAIDPCGHTGCGNGANGVTPGTGGTLGTQASATAGLGGTGDAQVSGAAGGGGGGGGYAGGGKGTNTAGTPPVYGGGPGGGGDSVGYTVDTSEAGLNGLTQANGVSVSAGDGGIEAQGNDGYAVISWRKCEECQCPEASTGLPPALYICLTQEQVDLIVAATSSCEFETSGLFYIVFNYLGYPFMLETHPFSTGVTPIDPNRKCTRTVLTKDIDVSATYYSSDLNGCCQVTEAVLYNSLCTSACVDTCPEVLYLCGQYMDSIGVPACRDPNKYYRIDYQGCIYLLGSDSNAQCVSDVYDPLNVGTYGGETTNPPTEYFYEVGPNVFDGGFFCCSPITITASVNWSSVIAVAQYTDVCNEGTASFPLFTSNPGTGSGTFTFVCESDVDGIALMASPNACVPMSNPCSCGKKPCDVNNTTFQTSGGNCNSASVDPCASQVTQRFLNMSMELVGDPGSVAAVALTLTRSTASSGTTWASVDTFNGAIYVDDCIFQGSGATKHFASVISEVLDGCITATNNQNFWLGQRCCTLTPEDCQRCRGGSDDWVLSSISTTVAVFSAKYSVWGVINASYTYQELGCRFCTGDGSPEDPFVNVLGCCSGNGYPCSASWTSQYVAEQMNVTPTGSSFMPCVLYSDSCASSDPPISVQGGGNIVLS